MEVLGPTERFIARPPLLNVHESVRVTDSNDQTLGSGDGGVEDTGTAQALGRVEGVPRRVKCLDSAHEKSLELTA